MQVIFKQQGYTVDGGTLSYEEIYNLAFDAASAEDAELNFLARIAKMLVDTARNDPDIELTRAAKPPELSDFYPLMAALPFALGAEFVNLNWILDVYNQLSDVLKAELAAFSGTVEEYFKSKNDSLTVSGRVFFHLVETREEAFPFAFMATYSTKKENAVSHLPLKHALAEFSGDQKSLLGLLGTVSRAADKSELISNLIESGELFNPLKFEPEDAYNFLREVPLYEECGIACRIPNFWKRKTKASLSLSLGSKEPAAFGLQSLIAFSPSVYFGDAELSRAELEALLGEENGLAFLKGKWVEVNHERISQILSALDKAEKSGSMSFADALRMQAGLADMLPDIEEDTEVTFTNGEWLANVMQKMNDPAAITPVLPSSDFEAELRHYQQTGLNWLTFMREMGFGSLLADDMGLGKTVQILAFLDKLRTFSPGVKTLLIVPASLLVNWQKEAARFAPKLRVVLAHGASSLYSQTDGDLFITTYGMASRLPALAQDTWDVLILDEAQAIKNPVVKQTKAIKTLQSAVRIAMTGTPIENRLSDLWSIFDFLNPGLLGSPKEFKAFTAKLKDAPQGYAKLRGAVSPFILRRLKTDKAVISDLPDKNEIKQFTALTKKQAALYNVLVEELSEVFNSDEDLSGIERKGKILAAIMKFKQICNHPDQYSGQSGFDPKHSGKFESLAEICATIKEKHESVLVFTQFREMCEPLSRYLQTVFERPGLVIHGGTTPKKRGALVDTFNSEYVPFMVLSLKAGGVGLNLTAANHVVHFDRWWNPAIENQATDRAFRIGQTKDVMVYKFVTSGTIEEKIDSIIESKQKLASDVIAETSGENWVTEFSNGELMDLFRLEVK